MKIAPTCVLTHTNTHTYKYIHMHPGNFAVNFCQTFKEEMIPILCKCVLGSQVQCD